MFPIERQKLILNLLEKQSSMTVEELSLATDATSATIRRDLEKLDKQGALKRIHGGAVKISEAMDLPFSIRDNEMAEEKIEIAQIAVSYINDGDTLFFDSSTTVMRMIPYLDDKKDLTIITNGIMTAFELGKKRINTICTGGNLLNNNTLVGLEAESAVNKYYVDKFFFSCRAVNSYGVFERSAQSLSVKEAMNRHARQSYLLVDSSKFDNNAFVKLELTNKIDAVITDSPTDLGLDCVEKVVWYK